MIRVTGAAFGRVPLATVTSKKRILLLFLVTVAGLAPILNSI